MRPPEPITTTRLQLREFAADDLAALLAYQTDPRMLEFYGPDEGQPEQLGELLRTFLAWAAESPRRNWQLAIALRQEPRPLIGSCGLRQAGLEPGSAEFGLDLAPAVWGKGFATEAAGALLDFGFGQLGLDVVRGFTVSANTRVTGLVRRLGFRAVCRHPGPGWMRARGWSRVEWELGRDRWVAVRGGGGGGAPQR